MTSPQLLLVDDDTNYSLSLRMVLEAEGVAPPMRTVGTLREALAVIDESPPDVVLLDLNLPDQRGFDTLLAVRRAAPETAIVVCTGEAGWEVLGAALELGADGYLVKGSFDGGLLLRQCAHAYRSRRALSTASSLRRRLDLVLRQMPAAMWTTSADLNLDSAFGAAAERLGLADGESNGRSCLEVFGERGLTALISAHMRAQLGETTVLELFQNGSIFQVCVAPIEEPPGFGRGCVGLACDMTRLRRLEIDVEAAKRVQAATFPEAPPQVRGMDIAGATELAEHASGDCFDYFTLPGGGLAVLVGDVCGHGLAPAVLMTRLHAYLVAVCTAGLGPAEALSGAAGLISRRGGVPFASFFLAIIQPETGQIRYAAAGHEAYLLRASGETLRLAALDPPLGVGRPYPPDLLGEARLHQGTVLLIPTDGLCESGALRDAPLGADGMLQAARQRQEAPATEIVASVFRAAARARRDAPPHDDCTLAVVKFHGTVSGA